jgi:hypothetical protein
MISWSDILLAIFTLVVCYFEFPELSFSVDGGCSSCASLLDFLFGGSSMDAWGVFLVG